MVWYGGVHESNHRASELPPSPLGIDPVSGADRALRQVRNQRQINTKRGKPDKTGRELSRAVDDRISAPNRSCQSLKVVNLKTYAWTIC